MKKQSTKKCATGITTYVDEEIGLVKISEQGLSTLFERNRKIKQDALSKQTIVNQLTLEYLRGKIKEFRGYAEAARKRAAENNDDVEWSLAKQYEGHVDAYIELICHMKGLTWKEAIFQEREGKL